MAPVLTRRRWPIRSGSVRLISTRLRCSGWLWGCQSPSWGYPIGRQSAERVRHCACAQREPKRTMTYPLLLLPQLSSLAPLPSAYVVSGKVAGGNVRHNLGLAFSLLLSPPNRLICRIPHRKYQLLVSNLVMPASPFAAPNTTCMAILLITAWT